MPEFFGKYRGKVENNIDPMKLGRIQVSAPAVLGAGRLSWAMPCVPYAGKGVGFFAIPPLAANVWVEFEGGDPDYPIWSGCFWGTGELPPPALASVKDEVKVFKTDGITLTLNDLPGGGGFTLEVEPPAVNTPLKLVLDAAGIELNSDPSSVKLTPQTIVLKNSAATIELSSSAISIKNGTPTVGLSADGVSLENGGMTIQLSAASVSINKGALEVM